MILLILACFPAISLGQGRELLDESTGVWMQLEQASLEFGTAPVTASNDIKGYTDVLPADIPATGGTFGLFFDKYFLTYSSFESNFSIARSADVNQTPGNSADDVYVDTAHLESDTLSVEFSVGHPLGVFFVGVGNSKGEITFNPGGTTESTIAFSNTDLILRILTGFSFDEGDGILEVSYNYYHPINERPLFNTRQGFGMGLLLGF